MTYYGVDIHDVYCHFSGSVTFSDPNNSLYRVECYVGYYGSENYAGFQGGEWGHDGGANVYGYSQCCDYENHYTWGDFYNTIDVAYMLVNNGTQYEWVAQDAAAWCPGATV